MTTAIEGRADIALDAGFLAAAQAVEHYENGRAIRQVCARFVALCCTIGLLTQPNAAIDGSKFKAVNIVAAEMRPSALAEPPRTAGNCISSANGRKNKHIRKNALAIAPSPRSRHVDVSASAF